MRKSRKRPRPEPPKPQREITVNNVLIQVCHHNLLAEPVEAIVNAANGGLAHGAGVAAAIASSAGPEFQKESNFLVKQYGRIPVGSATFTKAGKLPMRYVIHAVGPKYKDGKNGEDVHLRGCILKSLEIAGTLGISSIALPAISSGIFGYPKKL